MKRILFLALAVFAAAVFAADPAAELRNPAGRPLIAAHRGCWRLAPENSLSAIRRRDGGICSKPAVRSSRPTARRSWANT